MYVIIRSSINHVVCLMKGQQPLPKRVLHTLRSNASSSHLQRHLSSLRSSTEAYLFFLIFPSLLSFPLSFLKQSISKAVATQDAKNAVGSPYFYCMYEISLPLDSMLIPLHFPHDRSNCSSSAPRSKTSQALPIYFPQCSRFSTIHGELDTM